VRDESQRIATLERGLALLERFDARGIPVVVGDIPDMSPAVGRMLSRAQMPEADTIGRANARIREWARERPRVAVMPLARLVEDLRSGTPFTAGRRSWSETTDGPLIQRDQLHPTFAGTVALLARSEQAANERQKHVAVVDNHRQDSTRLDRDLEGLRGGVVMAVRFPQQDQMSGGGNGKELGQALENTEQNNVERIQGRARFREEEA
jgi:hypothetical protein